MSKIGLLWVGLGFSSSPSFLHFVTVHTTLLMSAHLIRSEHARTLASSTWRPFQFAGFSLSVAIFFM